MRSMHYIYKSKIFKILSILYIIMISQVALFIIQKQFNRFGNNYILWISICFIIIIIILEILLNYNKFIILFQIIFLSYLLHSLFIPVTGLLGSDAQYDFHLVELISKYGWSIQLDSPLAPWPTLHILIYIFSEITGIILLSTTRYLPSFISVIALIFMFCLSKKMYNNNYISLVYVLLFSLVYYFLFFHSLPLRETFGFVILFSALFSYIIGEKQTNNKKILFLGLAIFLGLFLILSHHFSALIFMFFFITMASINQILEKYKFNYLIKNSRQKYKSLFKYSLIIFIATIGYWIFVSFTVFATLITSIINFVSFGEVPRLFLDSLIYPPLIDIRTKIFSYSRALTFLSAIFIIIHKIICFD